MTAAEAPVQTDSAHLAGATPPVRPVVGWAVLGVAIIGLQLYIFADYILSGTLEMGSVPTGSDPEPTYMVLGCRAFEVAFIVGLITYAYRGVFVPWHRDRTVGVDGMLFIAGLAVFWLDPLYSYTQHAYTYNAAFLNIRSWGASIPGSMAPHPENIAYPVLAICLGWTVLLVFVMKLGTWVMDTAKKRWPRIGPVRLILLAYLAFVVFDIVMELAMLAVGFYTLPGSYGWVLFPGHYYQFPMYEALTYPLVFTGVAAMCYFKNDLGETFAERGLSRVTLQGARRSVLRFLAFVGLINAIVLCLYEVPSMLINLQQSAWPKDIVERSYLNNGVCGEHTTYACPGDSIPINRPRSIHIDPHGQAVNPDAGK